MSLPWPTLTTAEWEKRLREAARPKRRDLVGNEHSGNYGHKGRPGEIGGSGKSGGPTTWIAHATRAGDEPQEDYANPTPPPKKGDSLIVFRIGRSGGLTGRNAGNAEAITAHLLNHEEQDTPMGDTITAYKVTLTEDMHDGYTAMQEGEAMPGLASDTTPDVVGRGGYFFGRGYTFPKSGNGFTAEPIGSIPVSDINVTGSDRSRRTTEQIRDKFAEKFKAHTAPKALSAYRERLRRFDLGGEGSGNFGHEGRPGEIGGSGKGTGAKFEALIDQIKKPDGGFTVKTTSGESPTTGFSVSIHPDRCKIIPVKDLKLAHLVEFADQNADLLGQDGKYFGAWHNPENGEVYLDISTVTQDRAEAVRLGQEHDQISFFDLGAGKVIDTPKKVIDSGE